MNGPIDDAIADLPEAFEDPLEGLAERTTQDPGLPFKPVILEALAELKEEDLARFELIRAELKKAGCRVRQLDAAIAEVSGEGKDDADDDKGGGRGPKQADVLIKIAQTAALFHDEDGVGYADVYANNHRETLALRRKGFRRWLVRKFFEETGGAPNSDAVQSALGVIEAQAQYDGPKRNVHIRIGGDDGRIYIDIGDESWRAIEIDATGWHVIADPPIRFRRSPGMKELPIPVKGGSVETLRKFLNVNADTDFVLAITWVLACLRDRGPYPVLVLAGEQGSAKSTFLAMLRSLIDPNSVPLRSLPRDDREANIAASNVHVLAFDNLSGSLPAWISDIFCRFSTGGGATVRQLHSDQDEVLFNAVRPVALNGISDIVTRPDLADRALFLTLEPIPKGNRRTEAEIWSAFEIERPRIFGALLDAVSKGIEMLPSTNLAEPPRVPLPPWQRRECMREG